MKAMIFAAGRGERMRPLTNATPKPLLHVRGKPLIDWHIEKFVAAGISDIVINVSYLAQAIIDHVGNGSRFGAKVTFSHEPVALETGGALAFARPHLGDEWFAFAAADVWSTIDYATLVPKTGVDGIKSSECRGFWWFVPPRANEPGREFSIDPDGQVVSAGADAVTLANVGFLHTSLLAGLPAGEKFRLLPHYQQWVANGWIRADVHHGKWANLTSPEQLTQFDALNPLDFT